MFPCKQRRKQIKKRRKVWPTKKRRKQIKKRQSLTRWIKTIINNNQIASNNNKMWKYIVFIKNINGTSIASIWRGIIYYGTNTKILYELYSPAIRFNRQNLGDWKKLEIEWLPGFDPNIRISTIPETGRSKETTLFKASQFVHNLNASQFRSLKGLISFYCGYEAMKQIWFAEKGMYATNNYLFLHCNLCKTWWPRDCGKYLDTNSNIHITQRRWCCKICMSTDAIFSRDDL